MASNQQNLGKQYAIGENLMMNDSYNTFNPYNTHHNGNANALMVLVKDRFGNFIISTLLEILEGDKLNTLMTKLEKSKVSAR